MTSAAGASADTVRVDSNGDGGWAFNPDPANATPYAFSTAYESIGTGSLHVAPISSSPAAHKFIGLKALGTLVSDLSSISFDFLIDPAGVNAATTYKHFYLNVYTNLPGSSTFYDCRYDYVAASGSTSAFTTVTAGPTTVPSGKGDRAGDGFTCPAKLGGMPAGSTISGITLNVGQSSAADAGVGGYLDNVVISQASGSTTYDFEASPASKDDCKKGGFAAYGFANQGLCVAYFNAHN